MTDKKEKRQGQKKADGTTAKAKELCPLCGEYLQNSYAKKTIAGKKTFKIIGIACSSDSCDYIKKI